MRRTPWIAIATLAVITSCAPPTPEQKFVTDITTALGGRDKVDAAHVLDIQGDWPEVLPQDLEALVSQLLQRKAVCNR